MKFRTEIEIARPNLTIHHRHQLMMFGSCFAENMGRYLREGKFNTMINPFGISYNPLSVAEILSFLLDGKEFSFNDLNYYNGLYFHPLLHGSFSHPNAEMLLHRANLVTSEAHERLKRLDVLLVTFGTAFVYEWRQSGGVVNNCHKLPANSFLRRRLSVSQVVETWQMLLSRLISSRPNLRVIFTVSPIRHWKDGAHGNNLSKSVLLLAVDELQKLFPETVHYFPSYELILDELRDYRFYDTDMIHPSHQAVEYCWNRFKDNYLDASSQEILRRWQEISRMLHHRPLHPEGEVYLQFLHRAEEKLNRFSADYPFIDCEGEQIELSNRIQNEQKSCNFVP